MRKTGICPLCGREIELVPHHFIPTTLHRENWYKKNFTQEQMDRSFDVCVDCHNAIHKFYNPRELADIMNTPEKILEDEKIMKFAKFAAKQKSAIGLRTKKSRGSMY
jgi:hypothetical protein